MFRAFPKRSFPCWEGFGKFRFLRCVRLKVSEDSENLFFILGKFREALIPLLHSFEGFGEFRKVLRIHLELSGCSESLFLSNWRFQKILKGYPFAFGGFPMLGNFANFVFNLFVTIFSFKFIIIHDFYFYTLIVSEITAFSQPFLG